LLVGTVLDQFKLDGKVCIVTGASRGLGKAMALALAEAGADVVAVARTEAAIEETAGAIRALGRRALALPCDVHDSEAVKSVVDRTVAEFGHVDVLVNNAGGYEIKPFAEMDDELWLRIIDLNLHSTYRFCRAVAPHMIQRRRGKIVNMASMYGLIGEKGMSPYCAAKGAIIQLTRALALEWAEYGITANVLAPGYFYTEGTRPVFDHAEMGAHFTSLVPLGRIGQPGELGPLVVYLASAASDYMTGSVIVIDGAQTAK
jgi:NAD(P)-dependent dehydrogenase (short-subunit alcohol dehydrogenase family)